MPKRKTNPHRTPRKDSLEHERDLFFRCIHKIPNKIDQTARNWHIRAIQATERYRYYLEHLL